jgi:transposase, IS5 family
MPERTRLADAEKSKVRSVVEHVFAHQEEMMGLFVRTIGRAQARLKIDLANLAYNMQHAPNMRRFVARIPRTYQCRSARASPTRRSRKCAAS